MPKVLRLMFGLAILLAACTAPLPTPAPNPTLRPESTLTALPEPSATLAPTAASPTLTAVVPTALPSPTLPAPPAPPTAPSTVSPTPVPTVETGAIEPPNAARVQLIAELRKGFVITETVQSGAVGLTERRGFVAAALSADGKRLAVATVPGIFVYDLTTDKQVRFFNTGPGTVESLAFLSDGHTLAAFSPHEEDTSPNLNTLNQSVSLWDLDSGQLVRTISLNPNMTRLGKYPLNIVFSPDAHTLAVGLVEGDITLVDLPTGQELPNWKGADVRAASFAFSPDGRLLATMYGNTTIWEAATRRALFVPVKYGTAVGLYVHAAFSPDGRLVATDGDGQGVKLWDIASGQLQRTLLPAGSSPAGNVYSSLAFSPDGSLVAAGVEGKSFQFLDVATGKTRFTLNGVGLIFSPDGYTAALQTDAQTFRMVNLTTGEETLTFNGAGLGFSSDGRAILLFSADGTTQVRNLASSQVPATLAGEMSLGSATSVAFTSDGSQLIAGSSDGLVTWWDMASRREASSVNGSAYIYSLASSGPFVAWGAKDGTMGLSGLAPAPLIMTGHQGEVTSVAFSPDGQTIASASEDQTLKLWDLPVNASGDCVTLVCPPVTGPPRLTLRGHTNWVWGVAYSPDGKTIASASADKTVKVWDAATGKVLHTLSGHAATVWGVAFSPDGKLIASASWDKTIKQWDAASGQEVRTLSGHAGEVYNVAFSPDGQVLASTSSDGSVRLWETASGQLLATLEAQGGTVWSAAFSPDGHFIATASADGVVRLWGMPGP